MPSGLTLDGKVPVFVFPQSITFYLEDQTTHKRILTIYNPYDFAVRFKVLCTSREKYTVIDPDGSIQPHYCIDIVVRHTEVKPANCNVTDKFRIQIQDHATRQVIGRKDVSATLLGGVPDEYSSSEKDQFEALPPVPATLPHSPHQYSILQNQASQGASRGATVNPTVIVTGLICVAALLLPNEGETGALIPVYLSLNLKLVFSYVLGLVTMVIFRA